MSVEETKSLQLEIKSALEGMGWSQKRCSDAFFEHMNTDEDFIDDKERELQHHQKIKKWLIRESTPIEKLRTLLEFIKTQDDYQKVYGKSPETGSFTGYEPPSFARRMESVSRRIINLVQGKE